jgi:hypothetical protein
MNPEWRKSGLEFHVAGPLRGDCGVDRQMIHMKSLLNLKATKETRKIIADKISSIVYSEMEKLSLRTRDINKAHSIEKLIEIIKRKKK